VPAATHWPPSARCSPLQVSLGAHTVVLPVGSQAIPRATRRTQLHPRPSHTAVSSHWGDSARHLPPGAPSGAATQRIAPRLIMQLVPAPQRSPAGSQASPGRSPDTQWKYVRLQPVAEPELTPRQCSPTSQERSSWQ